MALKDIWIDKRDNVDDVLAEDINNIAHAVIGLEKGYGEIVAKQSGETIVLTDASDQNLRGLQIFGKSTQRTTTGAQLALFPDKSAVTVNGITWDSRDGAIMVSGKKTGGAESSNSAVGIVAEIPIEAGTYSLSGAATGVIIMVKITKASGGVSIKDSDDGSFTLDGTETNCIVYCSVTTTTAVDVTLYPMVNKGATALPWEPYTGGVAAPNPDFPMDIVSVGDFGSIAVSVDDQHLTFFPPNGFPGIPVTSGGNYTDADGQQWLCDEVDFGAGVRIRRLEWIESYNGEDVGEVYLSTTGPLTTGACVLYPLANPVETALTESELAAFRKLHTNKPATVITNDVGAWMSVTYAADTKAYIDNKFNELAAAIVSNT